MKTLSVCLVTLLLLAALAACTATSRTSAPLSAALQPYLRKSLTWHFNATNKDYPLNIYYVTPTTTEPREVVLYIKNAAWPRIGKEPDVSILQDYLGQKYIVLTLDLGNDPAATSPAIDDDINALHRALVGSQPPAILRAIHLDPLPARCFILPEGYRFAENLTYWQIDKYGSFGTLEFVMKTYNDEIVPNVQKRVPGHPPMTPAAKPADMVAPDGSPLDYRIQMDIIYPSQADHKIPTFVYSETEIPRDVHHHYLFQLRGYTYVLMGHCFNPGEVYWHMGEFTLDHWNGVKCYTAAIRYLNKNADQYAIDTHHIGVMGISKGQQAVTTLSAPDNANHKEHETFSTYPEGLGKFPAGTPEPQPWPGYPSTIACGWQGMGAGLWCKEFVSPDYVPTILACGMHDRDVITGEGTPLLKSYLEKNNANFVYLPMDDLGHSLSFGYDKTLGVDRYQLVIDFFDRYLKVKDKLSPVVLIATPRDGAENVDPASPIQVQFAPVIDPSTITGGQGIQVIQLHDHLPLPGRWQITHGGTLFTFTPDKPLEKAAQYGISITIAIKDKAGTPLKDARRIRFKTAG